MKRFLSTTLILMGLIPLRTPAQIQNPAVISARAEAPARAGEVLNLLVQIELERSWHVYAVHGVKGGPIATRITVSGDVVERQGRVNEPQPTEKYDAGFQTQTRFHQGGATFTVPIQLRTGITPGTAEVTVAVLYQVCDAALCYPPTQNELRVPVTVEEGAPRPGHLEMEAAPASRGETGGIDLDRAISEGMLSFILLSLSMGFLALLTPCVFPMIPITVSYFTHQGEVEGRNPVQQASVYALGIIATFTLLGFILAITLGASGANRLAANPWVNLFIGALFIYFALSLFGLYEIQLPSWLRQFSLRQESRSGYIGTLFMALTFTLTSFTCTVQFVGLLLVAAARGQWFWPMLGMLIFSAAFALPFFFLALFPQYLAKMPKSGGWLNSVKVVMGFLEVAAAFKFFSNVDLVWQLNIFTHTMVLASWTVLILVTGLYLLGKIRLPHDSPVETIGVLRLLLSLAFLTFSLYLGTGLLGRPIHGLIYSYLPPRLEGTTRSIATNGGVFQEYHWHTELEPALAEAARSGKPVFVDFTGYTCTNCRWMEANIFPRSEVRQRLDKFVLVQLFTDGGNNYQEKQQYEIDRFGTSALPFYVILSPEDEEIARFPGMTRNANEFVDFLDMGLAEY